MFNINLN